MPKKYSEETKKEIVQLYKVGQKISVLCVEHNIAKATLYNWIHLYSEIRTKTAKVITAREFYLLEKKAERLSIENNIWRNSKCAIDSPLDKKLQAIMLLKDQFGIHASCDTLNVKRSTFYHYLLRRPEKTMVELQDDQLRPVILDVFEKSKQRFGAKKIRIKLIAQGFTVSSNRIIRLMKELSLSCRVPKPSRYANNLHKGKYYKNKLKQQFTQTAPNLVWVSDITYVKIEQINHYICVIIDLFSRKVLALCLSDRIDTNLITMTFKKAQSNRNGENPKLFHSDQGAQYTSYRFRCFLRENNINQSFSAPGYPYDNAVAEAFFASLKKEELHRYVYENIDELQESVIEYTSFFNSERPHQKLNFKTPDEVEEIYYKQIKETLV